MVHLLVSETSLCVHGLEYLSSEVCRLDNVSDFALRP